MKPWQVILIVLVAVLGVVGVVYFATRRSSPADEETDDGMMDNDAADAVSSIGTAATGLIAGITRVAT